MSSEYLKSSERIRSITIQVLFNAGCVSLDFDKSFIFSSGIQSPIRINCEKLIESPNYFISVVTGLSSIIHSNDLDFDFLCGVIRGGVPFAFGLGRRFGKPVVARLGKEQDSERERFIVGKINSGAKGLIIEDVVTTGENTTIVANQVRYEGGGVLGVLSIFDYGFQKAKDNLLNQDVRFWSLIKFGDLIAAGQEVDFFKNSEVEKLKDWWQKTNLQNLPNSI